MVEDGVVIVRGMLAAGHSVPMVADVLRCTQRFHVSVLPTIFRRCNINVTHAFEGVRLFVYSSDELRVTTVALNLCAEYNNGIAHHRFVRDRAWDAGFSDRQTRALLAGMRIF